MSKTVPFPVVIADNESVAQAAINRGDYVQAFLLIHTLLESLLRTLLDKSDDKATFAELISKYKAFLKDQSYPRPTFIKELTELNRRRNRIVHDLWQRGYTLTNEQSQTAAAAALMVYGLFIEWLETFDPDINRYGFETS